MNFSAQLYKGKTQRKKLTLIRKPKYKCMPMTCMGKWDTPFTARKYLKFWPPPASPRSRSKLFSSVGNFKWTRFVTKRCFSLELHKPNFEPMPFVQHPALAALVYTVGIYFLLSLSHPIYFRRCSKIRLFYLNSYYWFLTRESVSEMATFVGRTFAVSNVNMREVSVLTASTVAREVVCTSNELSHTGRSFVWSEGHSTKATSS